MKVSKKDQTRAEIRVFTGLRFLHFDYQIGPAPYFGTRGNDLPARIFVFGVRNRTADTGVGFHQHLVAHFNKRGYAAGDQSDSCFVIFYFFCDTDDHCGLVCCGWLAGLASGGLADATRLGPRPKPIKESEFSFPSGGRF